MRLLHLRKYKQVTQCKTRSDGHDDALSNRSDELEKSVCKEYDMNTDNERVYLVVVGDGSRPCASNSSGIMARIFSGADCLV